MNEHRGKILQLLDEHGQSLYRHVARLTRCEHTTGDLMQDLFVKLQGIRNLDTIQDLYAYAWATATNLALDWRRRQQTRARHLEADTSTATSEPWPLEKLVQSEQIDQLLNATAQLNDLARQVIVMRFVEQASYEDIALRLNKKPGYLRSLNSKSLARLRELLTEQDAATPNRRCSHD